MDPTIAGALIGGGFAVIGFGASAWQNAATQRAGQRFAREQRLWEKRTTLYEALLAIVSRERDKWDFSACRDLLDEVNPHRTQIIAYGSDDVVECYEEAWSAFRGRDNSDDVTDEESVIFELVVVRMQEWMREELLQGTPKPPSAARKLIQRTRRRWRRRTIQRRINAHRKRGGVAPY